VWNDKGKWIGPAVSSGAKAKSSRRTERINQLLLDDVEYGVIDSGDVPTGFCEVDVKLDDNGQEFDCMMVSGHMASRVEGAMKDTLRPFPSWFMFVKEECEDPYARYM